MKPFIIFNALGAQFGWLATVFGAAAGYPLAGCAFTAAWLILHMRAVGNDRAIDLRIAVAAALLGFLCDSVLVQLGVITFPEQAKLGAPSTVWMVALWVNLGLTLRYSLGWLRGRYLLAGVLGAIAGPLAYAGGQRLGGIGFPVGDIATTAIAIEWLSALPALMVVVRWSERLDLATEMATENAGGDGL